MSLRVYYVMAFLTHFLLFCPSVTDTVRFFLKRHTFEFIVDAVPRRFSGKSWPQGSRGEACAYLSVFNHTLLTGCSQLGRDLLSCYDVEFLSDVGFCKPQDFKVTLKTCAHVSNLHVLYNLLFHFKVSVPNALYSILFLVDKEAATKPERDLNVQVIKESYCQMSSGYFN